MTKEQEYQKTVEEATRERQEPYVDDHSRHLVGALFQTGIDWARKNPGPEVTVLVEALRFYASKSNWLRDKNGWRHDMIIKDLDDESLNDWDGRFSGKRARQAIAKYEESIK